MEQKVLVSGYHGFIAGHLSKRLEQLGHKVVPIPRQYLGRIDLLTHFMNEEKPDYIFHLAAYGNHSTQEWEQMIFDTNVIGTWNMLMASKTIPYKKFVNFSTSSVLLEIQTLYSASKAAVEDLVNVFPKPILTVRPYSIYGEGEADFRFIPTVIKCLVKDELLFLDEYASHDWLVVDDFIDALLFVLEKNPQSFLPMRQHFDYPIVDIGSGKQSSNKEVVEILEEIAGKRVRKQITDIVGKFRNYDTQNWVSSNKFLKKVEWEPKFTLRQGLEKTYQWYKNKYDK